jgi:hypothetical protein
MESRSKSLDFPEDFIDLTAFGRFIDWMYGQELKCNECHGSREHHSTHVSVAALRRSRGASKLYLLSLKN